jgi:HSP20 family protein
MLDRFRRSFDQVFENFYNSGSRSFAGSGKAESTLLRAIVPGVAEKDVKVSVQHNQLILEGERRAPQNWFNGAYTQLAYGKFYVSPPLPNGLNVDKLTCRLHDGVLDIEVPVAEQMKPRQIQSGEVRKTIAA